MSEFDDPLEAHVDHPLVGQEVIVTLSRDDDPDGRMAGRLVWLKAGGEVAVDMADGLRHYGWPALDIEPAEPT